MNKLKNKVFITIFSILTISLLSLIVIYNIQIYKEQKKSIISSLEIATNNKNNTEDNIHPPEKPKEEKEPLDKNIKFMDSTIYTILLDNNNNIKDIINRSNNELSNTEISELAITILNDKTLNDEYIGFLYFSNYSYKFISGNSLTIIDNSSIKNILLNSLELSILVFISLEGLIIIISKMITKSIIKPVKESFDKQKEFIADASHELKTPLSVIIASSEALSEFPNEKKWLNNIETEAKRMNLLISDLLNLSLTEQVDTSKFEVGNLSKVVELSILTFEGLAYEKNIKLDYKIDNDIKYPMDENSIKELVEILLDNAIKHSKKKTTININLSLLDNNIILSVQNIGDEIPNGEEKKIFERFYRVDKSRNRKDNRYGLGLAIAKNIVENHNGKISAYSNDGVTTFKVLFKK